MANPLIKFAVRSLFRLTSREKAVEQAGRHLSTYIQLSRALDKNTGRQSVEVPSMNGVDEDMRRWSFFMLLEHNTIVNRSISALVQQLAKGDVLSGPAKIDPKTDVMPSGSSGVEQLIDFESSVKEHLEAIKSLPPLRGTATAPHPLFGDFDAHKWNCMFAFHLKIHLKQAKLICARASRHSA